LCPRCIAAEQLDNVCDAAFDAAGKIAGLEPRQNRIFYDQFRGGVG
jgi:hypothetical protein